MPWNETGLNEDVCVCVCIRVVYQWCEKVTVGKGAGFTLMLSFSFPNFLHLLHKQVIWWRHRETQETNPTTNLYKINVQSQKKTSCFSACWSAQSRSCLPPLIWSKVNIFCSSLLLAQDSLNVEVRKHPKAKYKGKEMFKVWNNVCKK